MKKYIWILLLLPLLSSCEKEIDLDYHSIDKLYVIEGRVTNEGSEVLLTQTRDMEDGEKGQGLDGAVVTVTSTDGTSEILTYDAADRLYRADFTGKPGETYTLTVSIGEEEFVSHSTMHPAAGAQPLEFEWVKAAGMKVMMISMLVDDVPGEVNYYSLRIYRNGENYRLSLIDDKGNDGKQLSADTFAMREDEDEEEHILREGDEIVFEVRSIDHRTYDYLYSWALSEDTSTNPLENFTGGCLGYFSAYSVTRHETVFSFDDVK